jgi:hypothetical protein
VLMGGKIPDKSMMDPSRWSFVLSRSQVPLRLNYPP